jgi:hypothetical protein
MKLSGDISLFVLAEKMLRQTRQACNAMQCKWIKVSFSSVNWGEKHCIRIPVAFHLYLVKII